jgi:hypothetical protein
MLYISDIAENLLNCIVFEVSPNNRTSDINCLDYMNVFYIVDLLLYCNIGIIFTN